MNQALPRSEVASCGTLRPQISVRRLTLLMALAALVASLWAPSLSADDPASTSSGPASDYYLMSPNQGPSGSIVGNPPPVSHGVGGFGILGRAGHEVGPTVGRTDSISYMDFMPYMFLEETMLFGDMRINVGNNGNFGGSAGLGLRHYFFNANAVSGLLVAYQRDHTRGVSFEELDVSHEWLSEWFDVRTNVYVPFGTRDYITSTVFEPGSQQFEGHNITFQRRSFTSTSMTGFDQTYSIPIPGELAQSVNLEGSAGWYHFQAPNREFAWGYKLRMDADILDRIGHMHVEFTSDKVFGNNVIFGADVNYWHDLESRPRIGQSQYNRMASWVRKNRTVVSDDSSFLNDREVARDLNGDAYVVYHVSHVPGEPLELAPDGTIDNPFNYIQEGIDAAPFADIVFVHSDSVFDGDTLPPGVTPNVVLRDDVLVLGEGANLTLPVFGLSSEIPMPTASNPVGDIPLITNVTGDAVTMANNSRFAGFTITNVTDGAAIVADSVSGGRIDEVFIDTVTGTNADGLVFNNASGLFSINGIQIANTEGDAFRVTGGNASITFGTPSSGTINRIDNNSGFAALIEDAAGSIFFRQMNIVDNGGTGVSVRGTALGNSTATVTFDNMTLNGTNGAAARAALEVFQHSGAVVVQNAINISNNNGIGIDLNTLGPNASFTAQGPINITNRMTDFEGIRMTGFTEGGPIPGNPSQNVASRATFLGDVTISGTVAGVGTPAAGVLFDSQAGAALFGQNLTIDGSAAEGILISDIADSAATTGSFQVNGITRIDNAQGVSMLFDNISDPDFSLSFNGISISNRGNVGIRVEDFDGTANFRGVSTVGNDNNVSAIGIDINRASNSVAFGTAVVDDQRGAGVAAIRAINNRSPQTAALPGPSVVSFQNVVVNNAVAGATGLIFSNNDFVSVNAGIIDVTAGRGVVITNNGYLDGTGATLGGHDVTLNSVDATASDYGIVVIDSRGIFEVTGTPATSTPTAGSGGTITGMSQAGALFSNTNQVRLAGMDLTGNFRGVVADQLLVDIDSTSAFLTLDTMDISNSNREGLLVRNVVTTNVLNSTFDNNGRTGQDNQIEWAATIKTFDVNDDGDTDDSEDLLRYGLIITGTNITDNGGAAITPGGFESENHMVYIHSGDTSAGGAIPGFTDPGTGAVLTPLAALGTGDIDAETIFDVLIGTSNPFATVLPNQNFSSNRQNLSNTHFDWDGELNASIHNTQFTLQAGTAATPSDFQTAVSMRVTEAADVAFRHNNVVANAFANLQGPGGTIGYDLTFETTSSLEVSDHVRFDTAGDFIPGSGFLFNTIDATALSLTFEDVNNDVFIFGNLFEFPAASGLVASSSMGILFNETGNGTSVFISNNRMDLAANGGVARGIYFSDNQGIISLSGSSAADNNVIQANLANFAIFLPFEVLQPNTTTGQIQVNGTNVP